VQSLANDRLRPSFVQVATRSELYGQLSQRNHELTRSPS
jgi:hypothetical protein